MTNERRLCGRREDDSICKLHPEMEMKIDKIIVNQESYMGHQVNLASDVSEIKAIVNNGLKEKMVQATKSIDALKEKMDNLDDFQWFRLFMNDLRDNFFTKFLKWSLLGGIFAFVMSMFFVGGEKFWKLIINLIIK